MMIEDKYSSFIEDDPKQTQATMEAISLNEERASAAKVLIQEDMISEAKELIARMASTYSLGQKESLIGYALSRQGNCKQALIMFDKARAVNPDMCIPTLYYGPCGE